MDICGPARNTQCSSGLGIAVTVVESRRLEGERRYACAVAAVLPSLVIRRHQDATAPTILTVIRANLKHLDTEQASPRPPDQATDELTGLIDNLDRKRRLVGRTRARGGEVELVQLP